MCSTHGDTQAAKRNRLPNEVWIFLAIVAIVSNALVGWGSTAIRALPDCW